MVITIYWPLVFFTVCASWAAGLFAVQAIWAWKANAPKSQAPAIILSVFLLAITAMLAVNASDNWKNLFGENNLVTGLDMVTIAMGLFFVVAVIFFFAMHKTRGNIPRGLVILALIPPVLLVASVARFYSLASGTAWDNPLWALTIAGNALALGAGTMSIIAGIRRESNKAVNDMINVPAAVFNAAATMVFLLWLTVTGGARTAPNQTAFGDEVIPTNVDPSQGDVITHAILPFDQEIIFVTLVIVLGAVLAMVAAFLAKKNNTWFVGCWLVGACTLIGAFAMNFVIYIVVISGTMF